MLRFLHAGDFHLDSPFSSLSPKQAAMAREEQRALLERFRELATLRRVDLIFLSGDLFDGARIYPETIEALQQMLGSIPAEVFISPGNHDPYIQTSPYACLPWPTNVHIFRDLRVKAIPLPALGCTVYGSAFTESTRMDSPLTGLSLSGDGLQLGCFHADLGKKFSRYGPLNLEDLAACGLHFAALGHVHARSELNRAGATYYAYPGCVQGRGFDECGDKGVYVGNIEEDGAVSLEYVSLCLRQYQSLVLDLGGRSAKERLLSILPQEPTGDIGRIFLRGERYESELPMAALHQLAAPLYYSIALLDESEAARSLWSREQEESLCGLFLREMRSRLETAQPQECTQLELAIRYGLAALEGREAPQ